MFLGQWTAMGHNVLMTHCGYWLWTSQTQGKHAFCIACEFCNKWRKYMSAHTYRAQLQYIGAGCM